YRFRLVDYAWQTDRDLETALAEFPPDLVGLTATTNTFLEARRIAALIKSRRQVPVIIGGVHITAVPEDLVGGPFDVAVLGEGEETLLALVRHFDETGALKNEHLQGLAYQEGESLVKTPARPLIADLDRVPRPDYALFAMEKHYTLPRALAHGFYAKGTSLMPSRGCPYGDCSFCGSSLMWQRRVRFFSPRRVFEEIKFLVETYRLNSIIFLDDNFTTNRGWLAELGGYVRESEFFPYFKFDCESIAEFLDEEKTKLLKTMGCERIEFGFESGCQRVLAALKNQRAKLAKTVEAIDLCKKHGIKILGNFIFGWFDETQEEILETYDFIQQHPMDYVAWHTLAPYPGTRAWQLFEQRVKQLRPDFHAQDFYNMETCNTHLPLNPALEPAQAHHFYNQMRREAYQGNTQIIHDLHLTASEKAELWQAFRQDMNMLQINKPRIAQTRLNIPQDTARPAPEDPLPSLCHKLETAQPLSTREIMADFGLLQGHPWEHHAGAPTTTYYACLSALARSAQPRRILEIGTGFGLSAAALLSACDGLELFVSLDLGIFGDHYKFPESNLDFASRKIHAWCRKKGIPPERVRFFQANTQPPGKSDNDNLACQAPLWDSLPELQELLVRESFDVLFVDGKHTEDGLYQDMKT
ncbi:MAG: radical SAM protein, partial [Desulfobaccales bacterium]